MAKEKSLLQTRSYVSFAYDSRVNVTISFIVSFAFGAVQKSIQLDLQSTHCELAVDMNSFTFRVILCTQIPVFVVFRMILLKNVFLR